MKDISILMAELRSAPAEKGHVNVGKDDLGRILDDLHRALFNEQWYPVSEMLPERGQEVLLAWYRVPGNPITMRTGAWWGYSTHGWRGSGNIEFRTQPTHWRELPKFG